MDLQKIRSHIDKLDAEMIRLLTKRIEYAIRTRRFKDNIADPSREKQIVDSIKQNSRWLISSEFTQKLFQEILAESRKLQSLDAKLVSFQGEHGSLTELALSNFDPEWMPIPCPEYVEVFEGVKTGAFDFAVVPIENSVEGSVSYVLDLLIASELKIVGEIVLPVHYCLLTLPEADHREIKVVYSNPEVLAHCRGFIARNKLESRPYYDAAGAALMLTRERPTASAVIAGRLCADIYQLEILKEGIEDHPGNSTRFVILSKEQTHTTGSKCSIVFSISHKAGSLFSILKQFSDAGINLTRIESYPTPANPGTVSFALDFNGSVEDEHVARILSQVESTAAFYKFLGCYNSTTVQNS